MNKILSATLIFLSLCFPLATHASFAEVYLNKFITYTQWCQHLPISPDVQFLSFIDKSTPLTRKLREKWLYQLAYNKDWPTFLKYYAGSADTNLQCYAQTARYNQGMQKEALNESKSLWLNGASQPKACDALFAAFLKNHELDDSLIQKRIELALHNNNLSLARYLLKQLNPARMQDADMLASIYQHPARISMLKPGPLHGDFYVYGLKLMLAHNSHEAIRLFESKQAASIMNNAQKQTFLAHIALYKAIKNESDAPLWFAKVTPAFYDEALLEWEMRYSLMHNHWRKIIYIISHSKNRNEPGYQYWMARALAELGENVTANQLYHQLALKRNYYGFLASLKLHTKPNFENEIAHNNAEILKPYKPITDQIKDLYLSHQTLQASRLLNDFVSELPKREKSALAFWLSNTLHWHGKSVYMSNNDELNNQLSLRFPLAHQKSVKTYAADYKIQPELIYAVMRQESAFNEDIVSSAGANGLMQLMPGTARVVSMRAGIAYSDKRQLFSPQQNIHIGTAYLQQLSKQYHEHPVLMMAAYNAGPKQVNFWLKNHTPKEMDIWIETLPWRETRNYLKNIIAFYAVYQYRMHESLNLNAFMHQWS